MPQVSVVIPLYNKAAYIEAALLSVRAQSFQDLEVIVVDDGSSDGGAALVERFDDPRLALIRQANAGASAARNTGIRAAGARWVAFLDADDLWRPDKIARQLHVLERHPDLVWAAGAYVRTTVEGQGRSSPPLSVELFSSEGVLGDALAVMAAAGSAIWTSTVMVRRDALREVGGFEPALRVSHDVDLWVRLAVSHPRLAYVQSPIAEKRRVAGSLTALSRAEDVWATSDRARRWAELARPLQPERSALLRGLARKAAEDIARRYVTAGLPKSAREIIASLPPLNLGTPSWRLRLAARVPNPVLSLFLNVRRRLRRWVLRPDHRPGPSAIGHRPQW